MTILFVFSSNLEQDERKIFSCSETTFPLPPNEIAEFPRRSKPQ
jgi:hypothetical protein